MKRKREPELPTDPEEALRLKAEAARIAAEVFASAGPTADAPEEGETTKASHLHVVSHPAALSPHALVGLLKLSINCMEIFLNLIPAPLMAFVCCRSRGSQ